MTDVTPYLASAATAELEDWGPLEEATGEPMQTSGLYAVAGRRPGDRRVGVLAWPLVLEAGAARVRAHPVLAA